MVVRFRWRFAEPSPEATYNRTPWRAPCDGGFEGSNQQLGAPQQWCPARRAATPPDHAMASGFWISFVKKFLVWPKSPNFAKFRLKFIFKLFLKILLNIFKLLFLKFSNFGGGEITEFREISPKFWTLGGVEFFLFQVFLEGFGELDKKFIAR